MEKGSFSSLDEFLEGHSAPHLTEKDASIVMKNICLGMYHLHSQGICHRDIKLGNILIAKDLSVKIIDFGFGAISGNMDMNNYCGTPSYMCPELLKRENYIGWQVDIWALGVVLYRLTCGNRPFKGKGDDLKNSIIKGDFSIPDYVSPSLRSLIESMLQYSGSKRIHVKDILRHKWLTKFSLNDARS